MPDYQDNCRSDYSKFDSMTNEELEEILRKDAIRTDGETSDLDMILYIMGVLAERRKNSADPGKTPEEAFELFMAHYTQTDSEMEDSLDHSEEKNNRKNHTKVIHMTRWMRRLTAAAAVLVMIFAGTMTANAFGVNIWEVFVQWTEEMFHFRGNSDQVPSAPEKEKTQEYQSLQEALDLYKITAPLAPKWIPEGYELIEVKINESPVQVRFLAIYMKDDQMLKVQIKRYLLEDPQHIEQSGTVIEEYESGGIVYYFFDNVELLRAAWVIDNFECYISGALTIDEMKQIVDSIKERIE